MRFFKWLIEVKIKRLDAEQRLLYLANRFFKEVKKQGHKTHANDDLHTINLFAFTNTNTIQVSVPTCHMIAPGKLTEKL